MIDVREYVNALLKERSITKAELFKRMKEKGLVTNDFENALIVAINQNLGYIWARKIELTLDLPDYLLIKMIGNPTEANWKRIKKVEEKCKNTKI